MAASGGLPDPAVYLPRAVGTWMWMRQLCERVVDPVEREFGPVSITYGFAGPWLANRISRGVAPRLDQHAGSELTRTGSPLCSRLGFAVDMVVPGVSMTAVARWVSTECAFDRLYHYGADRPLHVSVGPEDSRYVVAMCEIDGHRVPRRGGFASLP